MPIFKFDPSQSKSQSDIIATPKTRGTRNVATSGNPDNQGVIFQLTQVDGVPKILGSSEVESLIEGDHKKPWGNLSNLKTTKKSYEF